jgi:16S rRNA processing protein RimM
VKLLRFGYFSRTVGLKGELVLKEDGGVVHENVDVIFIETPTGREPYFVSAVRFRKDGVFFLLEDVDTIEKAKKLTGKSVYAEAKFVDEKRQHPLTGFKLIDRNAGEVGTITEVNDAGVQTLLHVQAGDKDVILPLVDDFIEKTDKKNKVLYFNAPEGLIEMYLKG